MSGGVAAVDGGHSLCRRLLRRVQPSQRATRWVCVRASCHHWEMSNKFEQHALLLLLLLLQLLLPLLLLLLLNGQIIPKE